MVKALRLMKIKELLKANGIIDTQTLSRFERCLQSYDSQRFNAVGEGGFPDSHAWRRDSARTRIHACCSGTVKNRLCKTAWRYAGTAPVIGASRAGTYSTGTWILLGYGKTCREIAKAIVDLDIKIVTGNVDAAIVLSENQNMDIFVPGGYLSNRYGYMTLGGEWCQKALTNLRVDQAYLSIAGLDASGFYVGDVMECQRFSSSGRSQMK